MTNAESTARDLTKRTGVRAAAHQLGTAEWVVVTTSEDGSYAYDPSAVAGWLDEVVGRLTYQDFCDGWVSYDATVETAVDLFLLSGGDVVLSNGGVDVLSCESTSLLLDYLRSMSRVPASAVTAGRHVALRELALRCAVRWGGEVWDGLSPRGQLADALDAREVLADALLELVTA